MLGLIFTFYSWCDQVSEIFLEILEGGFWQLVNDCVHSEMISYGCVMSELYYVEIHLVLSRPRCMYSQKTHLICVIQGLQKRVHFL